jgi:cysteine desulfurase
MPHAKATTKAAKATTKAAKATTRELTYLDNNGTTLICDQAARTYAKWIKCYNPSADSPLAKSARAVVDATRAYIQTLCNAGNYDIVFTSGGTESNCFMLRSAVSSYARIVKRKPHLVVSAVEHHSILECCHSLERCNAATVTYIQPDMHGRIAPSDVEKAITSNTCLVSIMYANNELGTINNIPAIAKICQKKVAFHSDCVQMFGKFKINMEKTGLDAISVSLHKLYGPKGIGLLLIRKDFVRGYELEGIINGSQQDGLRGGTENVPAIASALAAMKWNFHNRKAKNAKLEALCTSTIKRMAAHMPVVDYAAFLASPTKHPFMLVVLGKQRIPNTLLMSFTKTSGTPFCNVAFKKALARENIVVSISSACLTASATASHVLTAIRAPEPIKKGVIRVSFSDYSTERDVARFCSACIQLLKKQRLV